VKHCIGRNKNKKKKEERGCLQREAWCVWVVGGEPFVMKKRNGFSLPPYVPGPLPYLVIGRLAGAATREPGVPKKLGQTK